MKSSGSGSGDKGKPILPSVSGMMAARGRPFTKVINRKPGYIVQYSSFRWDNLSAARQFKVFFGGNNAHLSSTTFGVAPPCSFPLISLNPLTSPIIGCPLMSSAFCSHVHPCTTSEQISIRALYDSGGVSREVRRRRTEGTRRLSRGGEGSNSMESREVREVAELMSSSASIG